MRSMVRRNITLYFRDKANVFFSMLSIMIIIALYALFLGQGYWGSDGIRDSWLMSGVLAVATLTTALGAFVVMVEDKANKIAKGFYASPVKRSHIATAYMISPFVVSVIMTILTALGFGAYIALTDGYMPDTGALLQIMGLILLSSITATAIACFMVSFMKTISVYGTVSTIVGTLAGFLMGIYMPIGILPRAVQTVMMLFPPSHAAMLFRQILMEQPLETISATGYDVTNLKETLGVIFYFGEFEVTPAVSITFLVATTIFFFGLSIINIRKAKVG